MRIALLGFDEQLSPVFTAVASHGVHELSLAYDVGPFANRIRGLSPQTRVLPHWEGLLASGEPDVVLIGREPDAESRVEQIRKVLQENLPAVVSFPISLDSLACYELEMVREEHGGQLIPIMPWRLHPVVHQLQRMIGGSDEFQIGRIERIVIERTMAGTAQPEVALELTRDIDLLSLLIGDLTQVSAMCPPPLDRWDNLGIQLTGPADVLVRWSLDSRSEVLGATVTVRGGNGSARLQAPQEGAWRLEVESASGSNHFADEQWDAGSAILTACEQLASDNHPEYPSLWLSSCRAIELTEAVQRSLARGRTIEVRLEGYEDERGNFQATMAAAGCALLLAGCLIGLFAAMLGAFRINLSAWPYVLTFVLGLFLLLQLFGWLIPKKERSPTAVDNDLDGEPHR